MFEAIFFHFLVFFRSFFALFSFFSIFFLIFFLFFSGGKIAWHFLRRDHANLLCIVPIVVYVLPKYHVYSLASVTFILLEEPNNESMW